MLVEMGELLINPICCFPGLCPSPSLIRANPGCVPRAGEEMRWGGIGGQALPGGTTHKPHSWQTPPPRLSASALSDPTAISHITFRHISPAFPHVSMHRHTTQPYFPVTQFLISRVTYLFLMPVTLRPWRGGGMVPSPPQLRAVS